MNDINSSKKDRNTQSSKMTFKTKNIEINISSDDGFDIEHQQQHQERESESENELQQQFQRPQFARQTDQRPQQKSKNLKENYAYPLQQNQYDDKDDGGYEQEDSNLIQNRDNYPIEDDEEEEQSQYDEQEHLMNRQIIINRMKDQRNKMKGNQDDLDEQELLSMRQQKLENSKGKANKRRMNQEQDDSNINNPLDDTRVDDVNGVIGKSQNPLIDDNVQQKEFLTQFGSLKLILGIILFFSLFLTVFGFVAYEQTRFSIFSWIATMVEQDLQRIYYSNLSSTFGFEALFIFFNLSAILMSIMVFLGIASAISLNSAMAALESMHGGAFDEWEQHFGKGTQLESIQLLTKAFFIIASFSCLLISLLLLVVFIRGIEIGSTQHSNRITATFYTFNNVLLPLLLMALVYVTVNANKEVTSLPVIGDRFFPYAQSSLVSYYADSFDSYYEINWGKLMIHVNKNYYNVDDMNCYGGKYVNNFNSTSFYNLKCDNKNEIAYIWENEYSKNIQDQNILYGCINQSCKAVFGQWVSSTIKYLALIGFTTSAVCLIMIGISVNIWKKLANGSDRIMWHNKGIEFMFLGLSFLIIFVLAFMIAFETPDPPEIFPFATEQPREIYNSQYEVNIESINIRKELLEVNQGSFPVYGIQIAEDQSQCKPDCQPLLYYVELSTQDGKIKIDSNEDKNMYNQQKNMESNLVFNSTNGMQSNNAYVVAFYGSFKDVNNALNNLLFEPNCPIKSGLSISIKVNTQGENGNEANGQMVSAAAGQVVEVRGPGVFSIIDSNYADETLQPGIQSCEQKTTITDINGEFVMEFPVMKNNLAYQVSFAFENANFKSSQKIIQFGGIVFEKEKYFQTYLIRKNVDILSYYSSQLIDASTFNPISKAKVSIFEGGNTTKIERQQALSVMVPDFNGTFELFNLFPGQIMINVNDSTGQYMPYLESNVFLLGDKYSSKSHFRDIFLNDAKDDQYQVRLVLTWLSQDQSKASIKNRDLDLFVDFQLKDKFVCSVGFYNPLCQGVIGNFDSQNQRPEVRNAETVTFNAIGEYQYLVYVGEYLDKQILSQQQIQDTEARIDLYIRGQNYGPVAKFYVPYTKTAVSQGNSKPYRYWGVFCFDGSLSLNKIVSLGYLGFEKPIPSLCQINNI
ncbi:UNKNOWN [Stylonychia lemnae]|uniref:Transmembrane protein n=1 Tax=Stylonychia lemnae TaxID=5949 RepID=A0A078ARV2_STYLE|nr:UNKNOWN [Stylonychia lemnae]|eukprot:CDW85215.1 UNKNOWN [Stylonychia lemnae]